MKDVMTPKTIKCPGKLTVFILLKYAPLYSPVTIWALVLIITITYCTRSDKFSVLFKIYMKTYEPSLVNNVLFVTVSTKLRRSQVYYA